jgi:hypothetical protein
MSAELLGVVARIEDKKSWVEQKVGMREGRVVGGQCIGRTGNSMGGIIKHPSTKHGICCRSSLSHFHHFA